MKLKKVLSVTFAMLVLSSSLCFASVERYSISETVMKTKCTDQARSSVYVKNGSSYTEYWCTRSGPSAAHEIAEELSDGVEVFWAACAFPELMSTISFSQPPTLYRTECRLYIDHRMPIEYY